MDIGRLLRVQAHANRLANLRLHSAMAALPQTEMHAPRVAFFPSLMATLNHILSVDGYYIGALARQAGLDEYWDGFVPAETLADLAQRQQRSDERLIVFCDQEQDFDRAVHLPRGQGRVQIDAAAFVLQHLFSHQVHHRGQLHTMLSATATQPPQLDEFIMPSEPHLRSAEMAALGWHESGVYGPRL